MADPEAAKPKMFKALSILSQDSALLEIGKDCYLEQMREPLNLGEFYEFQRKQSRSPAPTGRMHREDMMRRLEEGRGRLMRTADRLAVGKDQTTIN